MNAPILRNDAAEFEAALLDSARRGVREIVTPASEGRPLMAKEGFVMERQPVCEVLLSLAGTCEYALGNRVFTVGPNCAVLIPAWCPHARFYRECDDGVTHLWILAEYRHCRCFTVRQGRIQVLKSFSFPLSVHLSLLTLSRWEAWEKSGARPETCPQYLLNVLDATLDELFIARERGFRNERADLVADTLTTIRSQYGCNCSLEFLARRAGCSKFHLAHLIRERTGRTVKSFVDEARTEYIQAARMHGIMQKEIAANLGFSSPSACGNWMRKHLPAAGQSETSTSGTIWSA